MRLDKIGEIFGRMVAKLNKFTDEKTNIKQNPFIPLDICFNNLLKNTKNVKPFGTTYIRDKNEDIIHYYLTNPNIKSFRESFSYISPDTSKRYTMTLMVDDLMGDKKVTMVIGYNGQFVDCASCVINDYTEEALAKALVTIDHDIVYILSALFDALLKKYKNYNVKTDIDTFYTIIRRLVDDYVTSCGYNVDYR